MESQPGQALIRLAAESLAVTPPGAEEPAVRRRSLAVARGEALGLAGPNGSGKTSLLLGLAGLWPSSGALRLDGAPFGYGCDPGVRRSLALIQQDPSSQMLQPTVLAELGFALRNLAFPEDEIAARTLRIAERLGLAAELDRDPRELSAGRQQMVLLGAAFAASPAVLLADEPTAHMDEPSRDRVLAVLREEKERGLAVIWASQNARELAAMDRVLELETAIAPRSGAPAPAIDPGPSRLRVRALPPGASLPAEAPRIRLDRPLEIEIGRRGISAVAGPNGAGKSVLLAAVAGLIESPQVSIEWREVVGPPPIAALQFPEQQIFQELVSDEITYASVLRGRSAAETLAQASNWLRRLDFVPETFLRQRTWTLALGAKRLTEVIAALVAPASLVLLDEPTAGLDPGRRAALGETVRELALERPILVATQDREWLARNGISVTEIAPASTPKAPKGLENP